MSKFNLIVIGIIMGLVALAFLVLSGAIPGLPGVAKTPPASLTIWGALPKSSLKKTIDLINEKNTKSFFIRYFEKEEDVYEDDLLDALASGSGPDIWILTQDLILKHKGKSYEIPFSVFSKRSFSDSFVDEAELFLSEAGIIAVPFMIDPIVLYWNKDLFNKAGLPNPPRFWEEFLDYAAMLTQKDASGNIVQSGVAMGEFSNIENAKDIFSLLVLQGNSPVFPFASALNFFTAFSNPSKVSYSWNRALPNSKDAFAAGKLAMYFGYAGEFKGIKEANPHLNFDVVNVPQIKDFSAQTTFGKMYALFISKSSLNINKSVAAAFGFVNNDSQEQLKEDMFLPPIKRDLLNQGILDPALSVFYKAVLQSTAWLEPDPKEVDDIFKDMIESVVTGKKRISESVQDAETLLKAEFEKIKN